MKRLLPVLMGFVLLSLFSTEGLARTPADVSVCHTSVVSVSGAKLHHHVCYRLVMITHSKNAAFRFTAVRDSYFRKLDIWVDSRGYRKVWRWKSDTSFPERSFVAPTGNYVAAVIDDVRATDVQTGRTRKYFITIYGEDGQTVWRYTLSDLLPREVLLDLEKFPTEIAPKWLKTAFFDSTGEVLNLFVDLHINTRFISGSYYSKEGGEAMRELLTLPQLRPFFLQIDLRTGAVVSAQSPSENWVPPSREDMKATLSRTKKCPGCDLSGMDLSGLNADGTEVSGATFTGSNLTGANFRGANLVGTVFRGSVLRDADFEGAYLVDGDLRRADLRGASFLHTTTRGSDFLGARFCGTRLWNKIRNEGCHIRKPPARSEAEVGPSESGSRAGLETCKEGEIEDMSIGKCVQGSPIKK